MTLIFRLRFKVGRNKTVKQSDVTWKVKYLSDQYTSGAQHRGHGAGQRILGPS